MKKSLNFKINFLMVLVVSVFFLPFVFMDYLQISRIKTENLNADLLDITSRLSQTLIIPIWDLDFEKMSNPILAEMGNKDVHAIAVYDVLTNDILIGKIRNEQWNIIDLHADSLDERIQATQEIKYGDKTIAYVKVQVTNRFIREEILSIAITQVKRTTLLILVFIIVLTVSIFVSVLKPIRKLTEFVREMAEGNTDRPITEIRDDELGDLARNFTEMRDTIKQKIDDLNKEILERKKAEKELRHLRNYLTNIIDSMPSLLIGVDADSKVTQWNKQAEQITGIATTEAQGKDIFSVFPRMVSEMEKITESIRTREIKQDRKRPRKTGNGLRYEDVTVYPLITNGVEGAVIRIDDVTDRVRMEEMMIQSEKMLSVGGLAAGMAHEINNPLAGMMQTASVLNDRLTNIEIDANRQIADEVGIKLGDIKAFMEKRGVPRMLSTINESGHRVAKIVENMLSFARKNDANISSHVLSDLLDRTLELASTDYDLKKQYDFKAIEIRREYEDNLPPVPCKAAKIQQVLLNILRNGAQAMQEAGTENPLFIVRTRLETKRNMVVMEIEDNGPGMNEETRKRVFEPFFTTKPVNMGTGLGLSVSYFIITENHRGEMSVSSHPGAGARFIIRLPMEGT